MPSDEGNVENTTTHIDRCAFLCVCVFACACAQAHACVNACMYVRMPSASCGMGYAPEGVIGLIMHNSN